MVRERDRGKYDEWLTRVEMWLMGSITISVYVV